MTIQRVFCYTVMYFYVDQLNVGQLVIEHNLLVNISRPSKFRFDNLKDV